MTAVGLLGLDQLDGGQAGDSAVTGAGSEAAAPAVGQPLRTAAPPLRSGRNYTPEELAAAPARAFASDGPLVQSSRDQEGGRVAGPIGLDRLHDPGALTACLSEIGAEHGNGPLVVDLVDYARFQGLPALVVRFTDATGTRWAWVSGPECGVPGSGSDNRYRTRVG